MMFFIFNWLFTLTFSVFYVYNHNLYTMSPIDKIIWKEIYLRNKDEYTNLNSLLFGSIIEHIGGAPKNTNSKNINKSSKSNKSNKLNKSKKKKQIKRSNTEKKKEYKDYGDEIIDFIEKSSIDDIQKNLGSILMNKYSCDRILGEGYAGKVRISTIGSIYLYKPKGDTDSDMYVILPVVIKDTTREKTLNFWINDDILYVYSDGGIIIETIILYFIRKLIKKQLSPHLPLILEHSACNSDMSQPVDRIVTERHGLDREIEVKIKGFYEGPMWRHVENYNPDDPIYYTRMSTFDDLMIYANLTKNLTEKNKDDMIELPNGIKCNIIELIDYLTISYIITVDLLAKNNIYLLDMHPQNIFIHWLNNNSYLYDKYIGDTEYIFYKRGDKYYKIKTFGLLLKIGDVGASIVKPKKNILFIGQTNNIEKTHKICEYIIEHPKYFDFPMSYHNTMSVATFKKTCSYNILNSHPYDKIFWMSQTADLMESMLKPDQLLKYFDKYAVNKIDVTEKYLEF
jgi:hypothetical protein